MKRWNIKHVLLYSHDGRRRILNFDLGAVNIITGNSRTGKSAISEIIDYVMGSRDCHIPVRVRHYCDWVGLVWAQGRTEVLMCRRVPTGQIKSKGDYQVEVGAELVIPASAAELRRNMGREEALKKFEQLLGMGEAQSETFNEKRAPERVSLRHTVPFMLQDDATIINKTHLLKGSDTDQRMSIIDRLPYFLGATDVTTVQQEAELKRLKGQLAAAERQRLAHERLVREADGRAQQLFLEASGVDLIRTEEEVKTAEQFTASLRSALAGEAEGAAAGENQGTFLELYSQRAAVEGRITELRSQVRAAQSMIETTQDFQDTATRQQLRLEVVNLLPDAEEDHPCPICSRPLESTTSVEQAIHSAYARIRRDLSMVQRERPKLDSHVQQCKDQIAELRGRLAELNGQIEAIARSDESTRQQMDLERRRGEVRGAIKFYLDLQRPVESAISAEEDEKVRTRIAELEEELGRQAKLEALQDMTMRLNFTATEILRELPFEELYKGTPVSFNARDLTLGIIAPTRRLEMRDIGADENYLSLHVATMLAFHRHFAERGRPVPGVLLFDQLSRPYFPPDPAGEQKEAVITTEDGPLESKDRVHLKTYFDLLFREVGRDDSLQVIILEHAYFADDPRFVQATKGRWTDHDGYLVPLDWPEHKGENS